MEMANFLYVVDGALSSVAAETNPQVSDSRHMSFHKRLFVFLNGRAPVYP